jgi:hypothetical protein
MTASLSGDQIIQTTLESKSNIRRTSFIVFEHNYECAPFFSFAEINGEKFGKLLSQEVIESGQVGILINNVFYTWNSGISIYENGYEVAFAINEQIIFQLMNNTNSLKYVLRSGEQIELPTQELREKILLAIEKCQNISN